MDLIPQQPDFKRVARSFRDAANDFENCSNLPAVEGGVRLISMMDGITKRLTDMDRTMRTMGQTMRDMDQTMRAGFADLNGRMGRLETTVQSLDGRVGRLETTVQSLDGRVGRLETTVQSLDNRVGRLETTVQSLGSKVDGLDLKVTISNKNFMARMQNSIVIHDSVELAPLYDLHTGDLIPSCPETLGHLDKMSSQEVAELLRRLDESVPRAVDQRMRRLRDALGVKSRV